MPKEPDSVKFGNIVRNSRDELRLTRKELSQYLSVTTQTIGDYERGIYLPSLEIVRELIEELGLSVEGLSGIEFWDPERRTHVKVNENHRS